MTQIPRKEIYRYLGYRGIAPSEEVAGRIEACVSRLLSVSSPRSVYRYFPLSFPAEDEILAGEVLLRSANLSKNVRGCSELCMMAVTIGQGVDLLIRRSEITSMLDAAIYQAAGAAYVEAVCDEVNLKIKEEAAARGLFCRPRFSPGYGDLSLQYQKDLFRVPDITRNIAVSLSDSCLMTPSKSVTALVGLSRTEKNCSLQGCEACTSSADCPYRRDS